MSVDLEEMRAQLWSDAEYAHSEDEGDIPEHILDTDAEFYHILCLDLLPAVKEAFSRELTEQRLTQAAARVRATDAAVDRNLSGVELRNAVNDAWVVIISSTKHVYGIHNQILKRVKDAGSQSSPDDEDVCLAAETLQEDIARILDDAQVHFDKATLLRDNYDGLFTPDQKGLVKKALRIAAENLHASKQHAESLSGYAEELIFSEELILTQDKILAFLAESNGQIAKIETLGALLAATDEDAEQNLGAQIRDAYQGLLAVEEAIDAALQEKEKHLDMLDEDPNVLEDINDEISSATAKLQAAINEIGRHSAVLRELILSTSAAVKEELREETVDSDDYDLIIEKNENTRKAMAAAYKLVESVAQRGDNREDSLSAQTTMVDVKESLDNTDDNLTRLRVRLQLAKAEKIARAIITTEFDADAPDAQEQLEAMHAQLAEARTAHRQAQMSVVEHDELFAESIVEPIGALLEQTERDVAALAQTFRVAHPRRVRPLMRINKSQILLLEHEGLLQFIDEVIRAGDDFNAGLPAPSSTQAEIPGLVLELRSTLSGVSYEGVKLAPGDVIRSHIDFNNGQVGVLKQDHTGKVINMSKGLKVEELSLVMLKAAKMLLTNYKSTDDTVIICGNNTAIANQVYAALLLLKESHCTLKHLTIRSLVRGCTGPGFFATNESFAEAHLGPAIMEEAIDEGNDLYHLTEIQQTLWASIEQVRASRGDFAADSKEEELIEGQIFSLAI